MNTETMEINSLVSTDSLEKLKCSRCHNYLSYFPIYMSNRRKICGRCPHPKEKTFFRNDVYEAICEKVCFPCQYKNEGCNEQLLAKDMSAHEVFCIFKIVRCPAADCDWKGPHCNLVQHCHDKHSDIILKDGKFQIDVSKSQKIRNLLLYKEKVFIFTGNFNSTSNVLNYSVQHIQDELVICHKPYNLFIEHGGTYLSIDGRSCRFHEHSIMMREICLDVFQCDTAICGTIDFEGGSHQESIFAKNLNDTLLSQLKCTVCHNYLMPPLDLQLENQTRCSQCRTKDSSSSQHTPIKNIDLDEVASYLFYPCKYKTNGCTFESLDFNMETHQNHCPYENQICPLAEFVKCKWNGLNKDVVNHVEKYHSHTILNTNVVSEELQKCQDSSTKRTYFEFTKCYIIKSSNCVFRFSFGHQNERFCWAAHKIRTGYCQSPSIINNRFRYEVEVIDKKDSNRKLMVRQLCGEVLPGKDDIFANAEEYCYFNRDQIEGLLHEDVITFKVRIVK